MKKDVSKETTSAVYAAKKLGIPLTTYIRKAKKIGTYKSKQHSPSIIHFPLYENGRFSKRVYLYLNDDGKLQKKYKNKQHNSKKENLLFSLTFDDFCQLLINANIKSSDLGFTGNNYVLARYNDEGNYDVENCRFITQKENAAEKKTTKYQRYYCKDCGIEVCRGSIRCKACAKKYAQINKDRPSKEELLHLIKNNSILQISKMYHVSGNTIRKWCIKYNLPYKKVDIKKLKDIK